MNATPNAYKLGVLFAYYFSIPNWVHLCKGDTHENSSHPTPDVRSGQLWDPGASARESEVGSQIKRQKISTGEKEQVGIRESHRVPALSTVWGG